MPIKVAWECIYLEAKDSQSVPTERS